MRFVFLALAVVVLYAMLRAWFWLVLAFPIGPASITGVLVVLVLGALLGGRCLEAYDRRRL